MSRGKNSTRSGTMNKGVIYALVGVAVIIAGFITGYIGYNNERGGLLLIALFVICIGAGLCCNIVIYSDGHVDDRVCSDFIQQS